MLSASGLPDGKGERATATARPIGNEQVNRSVGHSITRQIAINGARCIAVQYFDGSMPIWFWIVGMLLAFGCMYLTILFGAGTGKREGLYITARAFVLAELVASLHWQIVTFIGMRNGRFADYDWHAVLLLVATYALCFGLAWLVERGNFSQTAPTLPTASAATATVAITIVTFAMSNLSFISTNTPFSGSMGQEIFYIRTLVDFCGFAILYAQQEQARRIEASAEIASINAQLESFGQQQEYLQSKENTTGLVGSRTIWKYQGSRHCVPKSIRSMRRQDRAVEKRQRYSAQQHTGNPVLDVILTTKRARCRSRHQFHRRRMGRSIQHAADGYRSRVRRRDRQCDRSHVEAGRSGTAAHQTGIVRAEFLHVVRIENYYDSAAEERCRGHQHHEAR